MHRWILLLALVGCADEAAAPTPVAEPVATPAPPPAGGLAGVVVETVDGGGYTYARLDTDAGERWVAGPQTTLAVGQSVAVSRALHMTAFNSPSLGRTFDEIWFVESWGGGAAPAPAPAAPAPVAAAPAPLAEGVKSVGEVLSQGASLAGQRITVQGVVVKVNNGILGRNWVHLRPSAEASEDLLVTTDGTAAVGDTVQATGVVATDQDFGSGYAYALLVQEAELRPAR